MPWQGMLEPMQADTRERKIHTMGFIKRLFGSAKKPDSTAPPSSRLPSDGMTVEVDSQAATRRELVRMLTRDSLRFSGIPDGWIESQVLLELGRAGQTFIHLRLVVKHWDQRLQQYTVAFQRRLRSEIERFEPGAREWLLSITWQFEVDDECPFPIMPDPSIWGAAATPSAKTAPSVATSAADKEEDEMQADLARLFAVRDANLAEPSWEATNLAGLPDLDPASGRSSGTSRGRPRQ